jgi:uncharacterized protein involved in exopolysaccharide biosynthesis
MTGPAFEAAGRNSAASGISAPQTSPLENLAARLRARWWLIPLTTVLTLALAAIYLALATPQYSVTAVMMAEQANVAASASPAEFLTAQRRALLSAPMGELAGFFPTVVVNPSDSTLTISIETDRPQQARAALSTMLDAYLKNSNQPASAAAKLSELTVQRDKLAAERDAKSKALTELRQAANLSGTDTDAIVATRHAQLTEALNVARVQAEKANLDAEAAAKLPSDPIKLAELMNAARAKGIFRELDQQRQLLKQQIDKLESELETQKQTLLPQHPLLVQTQRKIDQVKTREAAIEAEYPQAYQAYCQKQLTAAQTKVNELQGLLDQHAQRTQHSTGSAEKIAQLGADVKKADEALAAADKAIREATLSTDNTMHIRMIQPPTAPEHPSSPRKGAVLMVAAAVGLLAGLAVALIGRR